MTFYAKLSLQSNLETCATLNPHGGFDVVVDRGQQVSQQQCLLHMALHIGADRSACPCWSLSTTTLTQQMALIMLPLTDAKWQLIIQNTMFDFRALLRHYKDVLFDNRVSFTEAMMWFMLLYIKFCIKAHFFIF